MGKASSSKKVARAARAGGSSGPKQRKLGFPLAIVAIVVLGGGREKKEDSIDPGVGIVFHKKTGDAVKKGEPLCTLHYNADARLAEARELIDRAYRITPAPPWMATALIRPCILWRPWQFFTPP